MGLITQSGNSELDFNPEVVLLLESVLLTKTHHVLPEHGLWIFNLDYWFPLQGGLLRPVCVPQHHPIPSPRFSTHLLFGDYFQIWSY